MQLLDKPTLTDPKLVLDHLAEGIIVLDPEGFIQYSNYAVEKITGFPYQELLGVPLYFLYGEPEESIKVAYELEQARKKGFYRTESWKRRKDSPPFWCELSISPIVLAGGKLDGYTITLDDASLRKHDELELRNREERFRLMVEGVKDYSIFMLDPQGYIPGDQA
jgi:PAS domain S-box-containing protein